MAVGLLVILYAVRRVVSSAERPLSDEDLTTDDA